MSKNIIMGQAARDAILRGVNFLADPVKVTEGPRGRNCLLGQRAIGQSPKVTKDGVTVSNYADPTDPVEQIGADLVREAAQKTDNAVGDGTTASIVLAQSMIAEGFALIDQGANPMTMERDIHRGVEKIINALLAMKHDVDDEKIFQVATVSAHGDLTIGALVAKAVKQAGRDGVITAEPSTTSETYVDQVAGIELPKSSLLHQAFITHPEEVKAELTDCRILLWEGVLGSAKSLVNLLKQVKEENVPVLIVAGGFEAEALSMLINNKIRLALQMNVVRLEAYGESRKNLLQDVAALVGGRVFLEADGVKIDNVKLSDLGMARKVITTMSKTQIIDGKGSQAGLVGRVDGLRKSIEDSVPGVERIALQHRLAALLGGITIIKVGGVTVTEMEEKKDRVVDAMSAAKAAIESGIVAGGGTALFRARQSLNKMEGVGFDVLRQACAAVVKQIATNAGIDPGSIVKHLQTTGAPSSIFVDSVGYNAYSGEFEDLVLTGVIDPVKVVIESLRNAAAVACSILTMGAVVSEKITERPTNG